MKTRWMVTVRDGHNSICLIDGGNNEMDAKRFKQENGELKALLTYRRDEGPFYMIFEEKYPEHKVTDEWL